MRLSLFISGVKVKYKKDSLRLSRRIVGRSTVTVSVDTFTSTHYAEGEPVQIKTEAGALKFAGFVFAVVERLYGGNDYLNHSLKIIGNEYLLSKRVIAKVYQDEIAGDIVKDMISTVFVDEGVTQGIIEDGPNIPEEVFNYFNGERCMNKLAERTGFAWRVDEIKALHFHSRTTNTSSHTTLRLQDVRLGSLRISRQHGEYRNRQYIRGGRDRTDALTESFVADGTDRTWTVGYPILTEPTITVDGNAQTTGRKGVNDNRQFLWTVGSAIITQGDGETTLTVGSVVSVVGYIGEFKVIISDEDKTEQAARLVIEGAGSGINEAVRDDAGATSRTAGIDLATALLTRYKEPHVEISFSSENDAFIPGELLTVTIPEHNLDGAGFLITSVSEKTVGTVRWYNVEAIDGPEGETWITWFKRREEILDTVSLMVKSGEQDTLIRQILFSKSWADGESPDPFEKPKDDGTHAPGTITAAFADDEEVLYIEFGSSPVVGAGGRLGLPYFRKAIAQLTVTATTIMSLAFIGAGEGNGTIEEIAWYGGDNCTVALNSGTLIERVAYSDVKTDLEAFQIVRTDTKGY